MVEIRCGRFLRLLSATGSLRCLLTIPYFLFNGLGERAPYHCNPLNNNLYQLLRLKRHSDVKWVFGDNTHAELPVNQNKTFQSRYKFELN